MSERLTEAYLQRFAGIGRLYGQKALAALAEGHFLVAGLGGVGSWVAEALARSGVGELTLVDLDEVCVSNSNRQLHALRSAVGRSKVQVMAERLREINPEIIIHEAEDFLAPDNLADYIGPQHHVVIDAIDAANVKSAMIAYCRARKIRMITVGSAGGKTDPCKITCDDLGKTVSDPLLSKVRQQLYRWHHFAKSSNRRFGVDAVYSTQQAVFPQPDGEVCQQKSVVMDGVRLDCAAGFGSATMMTGTMGFVAAEKAIQRYLQAVSA